MFPKTDCKKCAGWYNSCSPDYYADYIRDPDHCEYFEPIETPTSHNPDCSTKGAD